MTRVPVLVALGLLSAIACTDSRDPGRSGTPANTAQPADARSPALAPEPPVTTPSLPASDTAPAQLRDLVASIHACDGTAVATRLAELDPAELAELGPGHDPSLRLLVRWEAGRRFDADGRIAPEVVAELVAGLTAELGQAPPRWWTEQLASAHRTGTTEPPSYDVGLTSTGTGDRRGELQRGPGEVWVRAGRSSELVAAGDGLAYNFSVASVELGPIPATPDATVELARVPASSTLYYALFDRGSGGFRFPLTATSTAGTRWTAEVCGPDRKQLGGLGYLITEIVVVTPSRPSEPTPSGPGPMRMPSQPTHVAVFTGETHGVAVDVFDPDSGARTLAWSSDLWFAR